jgi:sulfur carrier protein
MNIHLNGKPHEIAAEMTLIDLLDRIGFGGKPVVIELDERAIFPRDYASTYVSEGARVEVVTLAAGG